MGERHTVGDQWQNNTVNLGQAINAGTEACLYHKGLWAGHMIGYPANSSRGW